MNEGRKSQIILLDDRRLDIIIQPKLYSSELLDLVSSHFKLREKQYFGLGFLDDTNHYNWLHGDKRVLDHDFPKKTGLLVLHFAIRFYVDTIGLLRDTQTVELFYLNARQALFRSQIVADSETVFELAAHVLQANNGDFTTEEETREDLKKLSVIPTSTLKEHPSIAYCEDRVICFYEKLNGTSRGLAIVNYMTIIEKLPTYGIHYYDVKDKKDIPWWLGISLRGIAVYDKNDKSTPRKLFSWKNLENLYYRDKKFSIEVHGPKRIVHTLSSFNPYEDAVKEPLESYDDLSNAITEPTTQVSVSRRTFGASNVDVHAWFAGTPQLTKCIWSMAVSQHQFYLDRKQSKSQLLTARSMSEIAADLCQSSTSLPGSLGSDLSRSPSSHSLPSLSNSRYDLTIEQSDSLKAEREMYQALKARKEALEEALRKKTEEFKKLCLQEGELTGQLPKDTPLAPGEQPPVFRRRVGTAFSLSVKNVPDANQSNSELSKLELEVELQGKITSAAQRLASDKTVSKNVRKQRLQSYNKSNAKLKDMEKKLGDMRKAAGKASSERHSRTYQGMYRASAPSSKCEPLSLQAIGLTVGGDIPETSTSSTSPTRRQPDTLLSLSRSHPKKSSSSSPTRSHPEPSSSPTRSQPDSGWSSRQPSQASSLNSFGTGSLAGSCGTSLHSCSTSEQSIGGGGGGNLSPTSEAAFSTDTGFREGEEEGAMSRELSQSSLNPSCSSMEDYGCSLSESDSAASLAAGGGASLDASADPGVSGEVRRRRNSGSNLRSPEKSFSMYFDEDNSLKHTGTRMKHFVVSRGLENTRLQELRSGKVRSKSSSRLPGQPEMRLAEPESMSAEDRRGEEEGAEGGIGEDSFDVSDSEDDEMKIRREERRHSARVTRRKQTFILSRTLRKPLRMEYARSDIINTGYHTLERLLLEGGQGQQGEGPAQHRGLSRAKSLPPDMKARSRSPVVFSQTSVATGSVCGTESPHDLSSSSCSTACSRGSYSVRHCSFTEDPDDIDSCEDVRKLSEDIDSSEGGSRKLSKSCSEVVRKKSVEYVDGGGLEEEVMSHLRRNTSWHTNSQRSNTFSSKETTV